MGLKNRPILKGHNGIKLGPLLKGCVLYHLKIRPILMDANKVFPLIKVEPFNKIVQRFLVKLIFFLNFEVKKHVNNYK